MCRQLPWGVGSTRYQWSSTSSPVDARTWYTRTLSMVTQQEHQHQPTNQSGQARSSSSASTSERYHPIEDPFPPLSLSTIPEFLCILLPWSGPWPGPPCRSLHQNALTTHALRQPSLDVPRERRKYRSGFLGAERRRVGQVDPGPLGAKGYIHRSPASHGGGPGRVVHSDRTGMQKANSPSRREYPTQFTGTNTLCRRHAEHQLARPSVQTGGPVRCVSCSSVALFTSESGHEMYQIAGSDAG